MNKLKVGIPKGSLENATIELFKRSGWKISISSRNYFPDVDDDTLACTLIRAQEMSRYVEEGVLEGVKVGVFVGVLDGVYVGPGVQVAVGGLFQCTLAAT